MIAKENQTKERADFLQRRFAGSIFGFAIWLDVWFDKNEIKYIETKMETGNLYEVLGCPDKSVVLISVYNRLFDFQRVWLNGFLKDPDMPVGVQIFIKFYIAHGYGIMLTNDKFKGTHAFENSADYDFVAQRWMETCR